MTLRLSVVTPTFNAAATIGRTLQSIRVQGWPDLQMICVDGGSTDETVEVIRSNGGFVNHFFGEPDRGVADALNKGFRVADGDILCWLNADDEFAPGAVSHVMELFGRHPQIDVVTGGCRRVFADGSEAVTQVPEGFERRMALKNEIEQPSTFWRARLHRQAGELDVSYRLAFDWEWWNRLSCAGARWLRTPQVLSVYHFTENNLTSKAGQRVIDEMYRITKSYAAPHVADMYRFLFQFFDMRGFYDVPFHQLPRRRQIIFGIARVGLNTLFDRELIESYNWNWASKQIRGMKWY
ncbi:MAG: glycosyltransferase [Phreatobacter sp.]|uniref:glycosyltransferase family 2 protein n=1 Tax=Phreatobacter sp. TaxID=1966341 RepID=UPI001A4DAB70|nr:glycosyltransferase family 2 protein [Phreatobacter sp.]MBL8571958.1 glycosyltransferase [Phreatobacter sp.]